MSLIFSLILLVILGAFVVMIGMEGMWSGILMLFNVLIAGLLATTLFEPLAAWLDSMYEGGHMFWDFICLMGMFAVIVMILRTITDFLAPRRIEFPKLVDQIGGIVFSLWAGWLFVCFASVALQTAPLGRSMVFDGFVPGQANFFGAVSPDIQWLAFTQNVSAGPLSPLNSPDVEQTKFDPKAEFIFKYAARRAYYESPESIAAGAAGVYR